MAPPLADSIVAAFERNRVQVAEVTVREYPDELNVLVYVDEGSYARAIDFAEAIETEVRQTQIPVLIVVRKSVVESNRDSTPMGVHHVKAGELQRLIAGRNRVSDVQPSLVYVRDVAENLSTVTAQRHQLVFGRRGVGKSTLLVEARDTVAKQGSISTWINLQILRRETPARIFLRIARAMIESVLVAVQREASRSNSIGEISSLNERLSALIRADEISEPQSNRVIPDVQYVLQRALAIVGGDMYVFIDDFYYIPREHQPEVLDVLHGCVRDCRIWLKIASIKNLTRWFQTSPPLGLQTGHDADVIDLDITLEEPQKLRTYIGNILSAYCAEVGIGRVSALFRNEAVDRLLLASGGVPRDFLVLAASAIGRGRQRSKAKVVGVEDVNKAAGDAADVKIQELEEDVAANRGLARRTLDARAVVREFCLQEVTSTFYSVDFYQKEMNTAEYQIFGDLLDLRLVHLVHSNVSDPHEAGKKYEIFMLDLSQYTGARLKQHLRVLDLDGDKIISRRTRTKEDVRVASTAREVIALFRSAPKFDLSRLSLLVEESVTTAQATN